MLSKQVGRDVQHAGQGRNTCRSLQAGATEPQARAAPLAADAGVATHLFNAMVAPLLNVRAPVSIQGPLALITTCDSPEVPESRPVSQVTIRGVVWYQGESNSGKADLYDCQIQALVRTWRAMWHAGSGGMTSAQFPFGIVQESGSE